MPFSIHGCTVKHIMGKVEDYEFLKYSAEAEDVDEQYIAARVAQDAKDLADLVVWCPLFAFV